MSHVDILVIICLCMMTNFYSMSQFKSANPMMVGDCNIMTPPCTGNQTNCPVFQICRISDTTITIKCLTDVC